MDFLELAAKRESCRKYIQAPVAREKVIRCLNAARLGPSACNSQPYSFVVVDDEEKARKMADFLHIENYNKFTRDVPVFIVITDREQKLLPMARERTNALAMLYIDIGIAAQNICLAAAEQGLGTCIMGLFLEKEIKEFLSIPPERGVALIIALGYPASTETRKKTRRELDKIYSLNEFSAE
jgi:nitroreductase